MMKRGSPPQAHTTLVSAVIFLPAPCRHAPHSRGTPYGIDGPIILPPHRLRWPSRPPIDGPRGVRQRSGCYPDRFRLKLRGDPIEQRSIGPVRPPFPTKMNESGASQASVRRGRQRISEFRMRNAMPDRQQHPLKHRVWRLNRLAPWRRMNHRPVDQLSKFVQVGAPLAGCRPHLLTSPTARHGSVPALFLQWNQKDDTNAKPTQAQVSPQSSSGPHKMRQRRRGRNA